MVGVVEVRDLLVTPCVITAVEGVIPAGFPSPAADYETGRLDLTKILVPHPSATFTVRISGHSMTRAGIHDGDLALVDRSLDAGHDHVVIVSIDGELTCKRLLLRKGRMIIAPDSDDHSFRMIDITGREDVEIWGVVTNTIRFHL